MEKVYYLQLLLLDVGKRWGSSLSIIQKYLDKQEFLDEEVARLYEKKVSFAALKPSPPFTSFKLEGLRKIVASLRDSKEEKTLLSAEKTRKIHILDVVFSSIFRLLRKISDSTPPRSISYSLSTRLVHKILERKKYMMESCLAASQFIQVGAMITPT